MLTRAAKSHTGETREQLLDRVDARIRADIAGGLAEVAADRARPRAVRGPTRAGLVAAGGDRGRARRRAGAQGRRGPAPTSPAAINAALPDYLGLPDGADVGRLLDTLTDEGLALRACRSTPPGPATRCCPDELRLANGDSAYQAPRRATCTPPRSTCTPSATCVAATATGGAAALPRPGRSAGSSTACASPASSSAPTRPPRCAAILTSGARVESLVGPAGTGKSFVVGALAHAWTDPAPAGRAGGAGVRAGDQPDRHRRPHRRRA